MSTLLLLSGWPAYVIIVLLTFGEAAAFIGLFLPGETALLVGGVLAAAGRVSLPVLVVVAALAAVAGDSVGYEIGRRTGPALRRSRLGRRVGEQRWSRAEAYVERRGGPAVLLGRWVGVLRALVPTLAGMTRMPYARFLAWNATGGVLWVSAAVLAGYAAGAAWHTVADALGRAGFVLGLLIALVAVGLAAVRLARRRGPAPGDLPSRSGALPTARQGAE